MMENIEEREDEEDFEYVPFEEWDVIGKDYYRKIPLYNFSWNVCGEVDITRDYIIPLSNAGPIAVLKPSLKDDATQVYVLNSTGKAHNTFEISDECYVEDPANICISGHCIIALSKVHGFVIIRDLKETPFNISYHSLDSFKYNNAHIVIVSYMIKEDEMPVSVEWCDSNAVLLASSSGKIVLVDLLGMEFSYPLDSSLVCIGPEIDGARLFTKKKCYFLEKVSEHHVKTFAIGSIEPSAILYNSFNNFKVNQPENLLCLFATRDKIPDAVSTCFNVALREFSKAYQMEMFEVAYFGLNFINDSKSDSIVNCRKTLNVMNYIRKHDVGIPITYAQYVSLTPKRLVERYTAMGDYSLVLRICSYLGLDIKQLLTNWACMKILVSFEENEICDIIEKESSNSKFKLAYDTVALSAYKSGQVKSARFILNYESPEKQAPIFIKMKQYHTALEKAHETFNASTICETSLKILEIVKTVDFFKMIRSMPAVRHTYLYYIEKPWSHFYDFNYYDGSLKNIAKHFVCTYEENKELSRKSANLESALQIYQKYGENSFEALSVKTELKLLDLHEKIRLKHGNFPYSMSALETTCMLLVLNEIELSELAVKLFKIKPERYVFIKMKSLVLTSDWENLFNMWIDCGDKNLTRDDILDMVLITKGTVSLKNFISFTKKKISRATQTNNAPNR